MLIDSPRKTDTLQIKIFHNKEMSGVPLRNAWSLTELVNKEHEYYHDNKEMVHIKVPYNTTI